MQGQIDASDESTAPSARTTVNTLAKRGAYDAETIYSILDETMFCTVAYVSDRGYPVVIPTGYGRRGNMLYLHGKANSGMLTAIADGRQICITVFIADGIVVARSAFHHSMNYRSVVIFGQAEVVTDAREVDIALQTIVNHIIPERWEDCRQPTPAELKATKVLRVCIDEASAKVRVGDANDDGKDKESHYWAGVLPIQTKFGKPIVNHDMRPGIPIPREISQYRRPGQEWLPETKVDEKDSNDETCEGGSCVFLRAVGSLAMAIPLVGIALSIGVAFAQGRR